MNKKRLFGACVRGTIPLCLLLAVYPLSGFATQNVRLEQISDLTTDVVDISISESGDGLVFIDDSTCDYEVSVKNAGVDCWIRFKRIYELGGITAEAPLDAWEDCEGFLVAKDGYVYCTEPLGAQRELSWSEELQVPLALRFKEAEAEPPVSGSTIITTRLTVEAVQARGLPVDFSSQTPWQGVKAQKAIADTTKAVAHE